MSNADAINIGLAPQTHDNNKRIAVEIDLGCHLHNDTMNDKMRTIDKL
jgi:hypothetical protein